MSKINLIHGDSLQALKSYGDNYFDVAIVDPPYGINITANGKLGSNNCGTAKDYGTKEWDKQPPSEEYFSQLMRVSKNQIVWGANHFISRMPIDSSCWLVWDKDNSGNYADCELAWTSFDTAVRKFTWRWNGMLQQNMKDKEDRIHPTQKPVALYRWLLENYTSEGDLILDTHLGSGSIAIACHYMKRNLIGYEIDQDYYDRACKRFNEQTRQMTLW